MDAVNYNLFASAVLNAMNNTDNAAAVLVAIRRGHTADELFRAHAEDAINAAATTEERFQAERAAATAAAAAADAIATIYYVSSAKVANILADISDESQVAAILATIYEADTVKSVAVLVDIWTRGDGARAGLQASVNLAQRAAPILDAIFGFFADGWYNEDRPNASSTLVTTIAGLVNDAGENFPSLNKRHLGTFSWIPNYGLGVGQGARWWKVALVAIYAAILDAMVISQQAASAVAILNDVAALDTDYYGLVLATMNVTDKAAGIVVADLDAQATKEEEAKKRAEVARALTGQNMMDKYYAPKVASILISIAPIEKAAAVLGEMIILTVGSGANAASLVTYMASNSSSRGSSPKPLGQSPIANTMLTDDGRTTRTAQIIRGLEPAKASSVLSVNQTVSVLTIASILIAMNDSVKAAAILTDRSQQQAWFSSLYPYGPAILASMYEVQRDSAVAIVAAMQTSDAAYMLANMDDPAKAAGILALLNEQKAAAILVAIYEADTAKAIAILVAMDDTNKAAAILETVFGFHQASHEVLAGIIAAVYDANPAEAAAILHVMNPSNAASILSRSYADEAFVLITMIAQLPTSNMGEAQLWAARLNAAGFTTPTLNAAGFAIGDPYITPVYGPRYKLPDRSGVYRYISNKSPYANRFFIDADVVMLTKKQQAEALHYALAKERKKIQAADGKLVLDGYFFRNYMLTNCGEKLLIDMEADTINGEPIKNIKTDKFSVSIGTERAPLTYPYTEQQETVYSLTIETFHETYGNIKVVLHKYKNPQIRNGIHMYTENKLTHENSKGFIMHFQHYKQFSIRKLGSKKDIDSFDKAKVPGRKKQVTEEFVYPERGTKNLRFLQQ
tara:strand:- start:401 stop:2962 length:2562 start_codon:yes stop_codon:yes gene_type:complete